MTPETRVFNAICSYLSAMRVFFWKVDSVGIFDPVKRRYRANTSPYRIKGVSDILGIWRGRPLAIEVKSEKGRLRPEQREFLERFRSEGGIAFMARSIDDVKRELEGK